MLTAEHFKVWPKFLAIIGIAIAVVNMALAWKIMYMGLESRSVAQQVQNVHAPVPDITKIDDKEPYAFLLKAIIQYAPSLLEAWKQDSAMENNRSAVVLGFSFSVIAIGFSLFVMGIESAVSLHAESRDIGALLIKASSPGIICIFFGAALIALNLLGQWEASPSKDVVEKAELLRAQADAKKTEAAAISEIMRDRAFADRERASADASLTREKAFAERTKSEAESILIKEKAYAVQTRKQGEAELMREKANSERVIAEANANLIRAKANTTQDIPTKSIRSLESTH